MTTPSGRYLITMLGGTLRAIDLVDGDVRRWSLPASASWMLSELTGDRYIVVARLDGGKLRTSQWIVVDLLEGWLGFVPFCPPSDLAPVASRALD
jgi:hypothetical protein